MKGIEFNKIVKKRLETIEQLLLTKGIEYAREDRLHNFNRLGELQRQSREKALIGLCDKHYISLHDMIDDLTYEVHSPISQWEEKIGDVINYMILLEACLKEKG